MIINKSDFIESLTEEEVNHGALKFNIPDEKSLDSLNGEGVWGWATPEDYKKYAEINNYQGKITAILLNYSLKYFGRLNWGDEVILQCHGRNRPTLDPEWVKENLTMHIE